MNELLFPLAALAVTVLVLIPALSLVSHIVLESKGRHSSSWTDFGSESTFAWLVTPTLLPMAWLVSSVLHSSEGSSPTSCLIEHVHPGECLDVLILQGFLLTGTMAMFAHRLWLDWPRLHANRLRADHELVGSTVRFLQNDPVLHKMRIVVVRGSQEPVYTLGLVRPIVVLDACFVEDADPEVLRASLLHEHAHITGKDTLRCFLVRLCLNINPTRAWLAPNYERWRSAREAACDGEAVHHGGEPLALAQGILRAARFECAGCGPCAAPLCGHDLAALKLRLALLMGTPARPVKTPGHVALLIGIITILIIPHVEGLELLDVLHTEVERLLHSAS